MYVGSIQKYVVRKCDFSFAFRLNQGLIQNRSLASLDSTRAVCLHPELENAAVRVVAVGLVCFCLTMAEGQSWWESPYGHQRLALEAFLPGPLLVSLV